MHIRLNANKSEELERDLKEVEKSIDLMQAPVGVYPSPASLLAYLAIVVYVIRAFCLTSKILHCSPSYASFYAVPKRMARQKVADTIGKAEAAGMDE